MNKEDKRKLKVGIGISAFAITFYLFLQNIDKVLKFGGYIVGILNSFIIGICIAFVLNLFMKMFEEKVLSKVNEKKHPKFKKFKRPISLLVTIILLFGIIATLMRFIIPQLGDSIDALGDNIQSYLSSLEDLLNSGLNKFGISTDLNQTITSYLTDFTDNLVGFLGKSIPKILETTMIVTTGVINAFVGFVFGIYMLALKERLLKNAKKVLYAFVPKKGADYFMHIYRIVKLKFSGFVSGQLTESLIISILCFIGMNIFKMEYALLISVIVGITNMIPTIGPFLGAIPSILILLMVDPMKAFWFTIFIISLQQIESNFIYPRVVGNSIGLPGIWVMFAIIVGGSLFGLPGVILGVPTFAVIYTLISEITIKKLKNKNIRI